MYDNSKFLTDASLARLAKWLRLLGHDTVVFPRSAGREMLNLAYAEKRIVLTRRLDMTQRQYSGELYIVTGLDIESQLAEVIAKFTLTIDEKKIFGICINCNERLIPVAKEDVYDSVPSYVFANCREYNKCPSCRRIYWHGTHQRNALQFLKSISMPLEKQNQ